jgi:ribose transport system permease protein
LIDKAGGLVAGYPVGTPVLPIAFLPATVAIHPMFDSFYAQSVADGRVAAGLRRRGAGGGRDLGRNRPVDWIRHGGRKRTRGQHNEERQLWRGARCVDPARRGRDSAVNGLLVLVSRVPDVIATLTTGFIWGGVALMILEKPGGGAPPEFLNLGTGAFITEWLSNSLVLLVIAVAAIWIPIRRSKTGLRIYATGSDRIAAFPSGVNVELARLLAYVFS